MRHAMTTRGNESAILSCRHPKGSSQSLSEARIEVEQDTCGVELDLWDLGLRCIAIGCWLPTSNRRILWLVDGKIIRCRLGCIKGPSARHGRPREREDTRYQEARNHANLWTEVYYGN
ncbi:unnamed protein product, partial [Penicillium salamii]